MSDEELATIAHEAFRTGYERDVFAALRRVRDESTARERARCAEVCRAVLDGLYDRYHQDAVRLAPLGDDNPSYAAARARYQALSSAASVVARAIERGEG